MHGPPERPRFVAGLIGSGIGTSLSPDLHERTADALGLSYSYQLIDLDALGLRPNDAGRLVRDAQQMGFSGVNVTHPCKQLVIPHLDELSPTAQAIGAVNAVIFANGRSIGHNTDQPAFKESLAAGLPDEARHDVVVLGAGGAGAAAASAVLELGTGRLTIVDTDWERADGLTRSLAASFPEATIRSVELPELADAMAGADGIVHATPTGMAEHPGVPFDLRLLRRRTWVAEIVYRPLSTELLRGALALGCRTVDGSGMAVVQAALSFELFTGIRPERERMREDFAALTRAEAEVA